MYADQAVFSETLGEIVDDLRQTASVLGIGVAGRVDPDSVTAR